MEINLFTSLKMATAVAVAVEDTRAKCDNFLIPGAEFIAGFTGYITECGDDCPTGENFNGVFQQQERCNGRNRACEVACPTKDFGHPDCSAFNPSGRAVCKRNYTNYRPVAAGTLDSQCCRHSQGDAILISNDCPPGVFLGSNSCRTVIDNACLKDITSVIKSGCEALATDPSINVRNQYNTLMQERCTKTTIDNLNEGTCLEWCNKNRDICNNAVISNFCKDKIGQEKYDNLCACFYPEQVYQDIRNKLATEFSIPADLLSGGRQCYLPICSDAAIQYNQGATCKDLNLVKCVNEVQIANNGTVGNITIAQDSKCQNFTGNGGGGGGGGGGPTCTSSQCGGYQCDNKTNKCATTCVNDTGCYTGYNCNNGRCETKNVACTENLCAGYLCNPAKTACLNTCASNTECAAGYVCSAGKCIPASSQSFWEKYMIWIIVIGSLILIIILAVIGYFIYRSSKKNTVLRESVYSNLPPGVNAEEM